MSGSPGLPAPASLHAAPVRPTASRMLLEPADLSPAPGPLHPTSPLPETLLLSCLPGSLPVLLKRHPLSEASASSLRHPHLPIPAHTHSHLLAQCLFHALSGSRDAVYCCFVREGTSSLLTPASPVPRTALARGRRPAGVHPVNGTRKAFAPCSARQPPRGVSRAGPPWPGQS